MWFFNSRSLSKNVEEPIITKKDLDSSLNVVLDSFLRHIHSQKEEIAELKKRVESLESTKSLKNLSYIKANRSMIPVPTSIPNLNKPMPLPLQWPIPKTPAFEFQKKF